MPMKRQRGLSLVELLVGVAVGLLVVAGAATVVSTQLADTRRLVVEVQVLQDLRATADIVSREVRRAASWTNAPLGVWAPGLAVVANPFDNITLVSPSQVTIARDGGGPRGFRLVVGPPGYVEVLPNAGNWQALTDPSTVNITSFTMTITPVAASQMACPALCPGLNALQPQVCWPTVEVRQLQLTITGRATSDAAVERTIVSSMRLPNDRIVDNLNVPAFSGPLCPG